MQPGCSPLSDPLVRFQCQLLKVRSGRGRQLEDEQVIQSKLEAFMRDQAHPRSLEERGRLLGPVPVVRLDVHPMDQPQASQGLDDAVDERRRHREYNASARPQQPAARGHERRALGVSHVLEDREERDDVVGTNVMQIRGKVTADQAATRVRIGVDADRVMHATAGGADERAIGAANVEEPPSGREVWQGLSNPQPLDEPVERRHAAFRARATSVSAPAGSRQSNITIAMKNPRGTTTLNVSSWRSTAIA